MQNLNIERSQFLEASFKQNPALFRQILLLGVQPGFDEMKSGASLTCFCYFIQRCFPFTPAHAQAHQGCVHGNTSQPRGESRMPMEAIQIAESIEKCGLNGVLGIFAIAKNALRNVKKSV